MKIEKPFVTNILKNGTVVDDMSKVTVPVEIAKSVIEIATKGEKNEKQKIFV